jgi:hypothetical protein
VNTILSPKIFQIVIVVSGIWLVLWLAQKISGPMLCVFILGTIAAGMVWDYLNEQQEQYSNFQLATANANCRIAEANTVTSQTQLAISMERTKQVKWGLLSGVVGLVGGLLKFIPHWFGH